MSSLEHVPDRFHPFTLSLLELLFIFASVSGDGAQVLQLRLHLHLCDRGLAEARGLRLSALLQGQVRRRRRQLLLMTFVRLFLPCVSIQEQSPTI